MSRRLAGVALVVAVALSLVAAGGAGASVRKDPKLAAEVPSSIASKGTVTVASDATYAPMEFIKGGAVVGVDADLAQAIGGVLGLNFKVVNATFDTIIPGLKSGKYDLGMSSFTDTKARQKVVDFVTYFSAGTSFYTKASGGTTVNGLADLCGKTVSVENGTTEQTDATAQGGKCKKAGKGAVTVSAFPDQNAANLAIASGRAQLGMADSPVAAYIVKQSNGQFKLVGKSYGTAPYGIAIPKGNGMAKPIQDALKELIKNGTYKKILAKWGVQDGALSNPTINGALS
ncbi:MAG: ABC transporter substrate-binding protein [Actinobacteria bacterium]|nr:ABC transporter substrate-binding protein [Actinomycetota bacterium]MBV8563554.1 ABC transporter substrate-binding protein [Actinomycetota bacterium]